MAGKQERKRDDAAPVGGGIVRRSGLASALPDPAGKLSAPSLASRQIEALKNPTVKALTPAPLSAAAEKARKAYVEKSLHEAKPSSLSDDARKVKDLPTCKPRPKNNEPRGKGHGARRRFIPWCG